MENSDYYQAQTLMQFEGGDGYSPGGYYDPVRDEVFTDDQIKFPADDGFRYPKDPLPGDVKNVLPLEVLNQTDPGTPDSNEWTPAKTNAAIGWLILVAAGFVIASKKQSS